MYAVVSSGGKQYRVEAGNELLVEKLGVEPGAAVTFDRVLLVGDGDDVTVGTPLVDGARVTGTVLRAERGPKIVIFKFKQKVKYRRRTGHRQDLVRVRIDQISANGKQSKVEAPARAERPKAAAASAATAEAPAAETAKAVSKPKAAPRARASAKTADPAKADTATQEKPKRATRSRATATAAEKADKADKAPAEAKPKRTTRSRTAKRDGEEK
jgi:large subunit ribosomal protein L21